MTKAKKKKKKFKKMTVPEIVILVVITVLLLAFVYMLIKPALRRTQPLGNLEGVLEKDYSSYELKDENNADDGLDIDQLIEGQLTVLCLGFDEEGLNTDVMMLFLFDIKNHSINVLQIPRDSFVNIGQTGKINGVYSVGDPDLTPINRVVSVVRETFAIPIDRYITINCNDIPPVVDLIGGIPIDIPERIVYEADKILEPGQQVLNGQQSEWFVRFRHDYAEGDIGRVKAQRIFLAAAMNKMKDMGASLITMLPQLSEYINSDLTSGELSSLADFATNVEMDDVSVYMVPGEGATYNGYSVWSIHKDAASELMNTYFRPYQKDINSLPVYELSNTSTWYDNENANLNDIFEGDIPDILRN